MEASENHRSEESSQIVNSTFFNCRATQLNGGAVYISGQFDVDLENNKFNWNSARNKGGAIFTDCLLGGCRLFMDDKNSFFNNKAGFSGGGV